MSKLDPNANVQDAIAFIRGMAKMPDENLNIWHCSIAFSKIIKVDQDVAPYFEAENALIEACKNEDAGADQKLKTLQKIIHHDFGYQGDSETYNAIDNGCLFGLVDRKKGLPVALGVIYLHLCHQMEWEAVGLSFPGHFLMQIQDGGETIILDPFADGMVTDARRMRQMLKAIGGQQAELSHDYYRPVRRRDVVIRLQNNLKTRLIETESYLKAATLIEALRAFEPQEHRFIFEAAVVKVKLDYIASAFDDIKTFLECDLTSDARKIGTQLMHEIRRKMN